MPSAILNVQLLAIHFVTWYVGTFLFFILRKIVGKINRYSYTDPEAMVFVM